MSDNKTLRILDKTHFRRIVGESHSKRTGIRLADAFSTQSTQIIGDINTLLNIDPPSEADIRGLLHRLQGSAEILGASRLSALVLHLLKDDQDNFCTVLRSTLPSLVKAIDETQAEIQALAG